MTFARRRWFVAAARSANAIFFLLASAYCLFVYNPFTRTQFIQHEYLPWLSAFVADFGALYWLMLLATLLTLLPELAEARSKRLAAAYAVIVGGAGVLVTAMGSRLAPRGGRATFALAVIELVPPIWLSIVDHRRYPLAARPFTLGRAAAACASAAIVVSLSYSVAAAVRLTRASGIELPPGWAIAAALTSAAAHLAVFAAPLVVLLVADRAARRRPDAGRFEYSAILGGATAAIAFVIYRMVFAAIAFHGAIAWTAAALFAAAVTVTWAGIARVVSSDRDGDVMELLVSVFSAGSIGARRMAVLATPLACYALASAVAEFDWNFVLQKLSAGVMWLVCFGLVYGLTREKLRRARATIGSVSFAGAALLVVAVLAVPRVAAKGAALDWSTALDRYSAVDPSFRLIRDLRVANAGEAAAFYSYLAANTLVSPGDVRPPAIEFAPPGRPARVRPNIFLLVVDSLRPDYLSPYNAAATFSPNIARFARDSVVFTHAFTRYGGTNLSVPAIWAGAMLMHQLEETDFAGRDALWKLVTMNGYRRIVSMDSVVRTFVPAGEGVAQIDRGLPAVEFRMCRTLGEIEQLVAGDGPVFAYALPQDVHIAVAARRKVPEGESYSGFFAPVASSVREIDGCFGRFIEYLQASGLYDNSIVILTSDHGDSLGEGGRYGHSLFMFPEVVKIPLIVHLPRALAAAYTADPDRPAFTTDLTPTLYELLGYDVPPGDPLTGSPLFVPAGSPLPSRDGRPFLLASSYGAVYAIVRERAGGAGSLYIADAVDGRDYAFDLEHGARVELTPASTTENRRVIREQLSALAAANHFSAGQ